MRETSFKRRLLALIVLAVGGGQALMTVFVLWGEAERYAVNKKDLLLAQAHVLAAAVSGATARGDVRAVYAGLRAAGRLPNIQFVSVSDLEGNRVAELGAAELLASDLCGRPKKLHYRLGGFCGLGRSRCELRSFRAEPLSAPSC